MKLKRFDTLHEAAKKKETVEMEEKATKFILGELKKFKMTRYEVVKAIKSKFDGNNAVAQKVANDIVFDKFQKDNKIETGKIEKKAVFFIGDAKDPNAKEETKKEDKKSGKIDRFEGFTPKKKVKELPEIEEDKDAKDDAHKDMEKVSPRDLKFKKDSDTQLKKKSENDKFKDYHKEIKEIIKSRKEKKEKKELVEESKSIISSFALFEKKAAKKKPAKKEEEKCECDDKKDEKSGKNPHKFGTKEFFKWSKDNKGKKSDKKDDEPKAKGAKNPHKFGTKEFFKWSKDNKKK